MPEFLPEELNLIYLYDPGNLHGLIYELRSMMAVLMPDENELRNLAQGVTKALRRGTEKQLERLTSRPQKEERSDELSAFAGDYRSLY